VDVNSFRVSLSDLLSASDASLSASLLPLLFRRARRFSPAILFIDDLDFLSLRADDAQIQAISSQLLAQLDGLQPTDKVNIRRINN
jgi:ATP-dependent 26S proteasome regulatory subunit